jgi:glyoxylase-like metal-dependent hydrolase (beta-lactamase superfamily II)
MRRLVFALLVLAAVRAAAQQEVVPGVRLIRGGFVPGQQPDGNTIILSAPEGLIVFDTGRHVEHTRKILDLAGSEKIAAVINSHWHLDHIGGNALIRKERPDVRVYASGALAEARKGFLANYRKQLVEMGADKFKAEIDLIDAGESLAPDVVIAKPGPMTIAGRELQVGLETFAVTAGDVWVFDPRSGVLIAGDLVTLPAPFLDTACPARWKEALDRIAKMNFELLIPGHGAPLTHRQFDQYRRAFTNLLACTGEKSKCAEGWIGDVSTLIAPAEVEFTRQLMGYYVDVARRDPGGWCGK